MLNNAERLLISIISIKLRLLKTMRSASKVQFGSDLQVFRFVGSYYLLIGVFALLTAVTFPLEYLITGIVFFSVYAVFLFCGIFVAPRMKESNYQSISPVRLSAKFLICQIFCLLLGLNYVVYFYTGVTVIGAVDNLVSGTSNYLSYQNYFAESGLGQMSLAKIAPILINVYIKLSFLHSFFLLFSPGAPPKYRVVLYCVVCCCILLLYSISRGTNIELFELVFAIAYCVSSREDLVRAMRKYIFLILAAVVAVAILFMQSVNARAIISCYTAELCIDDSALLSQISEGFAYFTFVLSGYFTFGLYYLGHIAVDVLLNNIFGFVAFPGLNHSFDSFGALMCDITFDCGVNWEPDFSKVIAILGLAPAPCFLFLVGYALKITQNRLRLSYSFSDFCTSYMIALYLISLPVGQFISASSQNVIILSASLLYYFCRWLGYSVGRSAAKH